MAIYHCNISVVSRSGGHSAVAGAAYLSRTSLVNERDGLRHDFTRAHRHERLVADLGIALPERAPERLLDRSTLWNEVERIEKRQDAQLCRRIEYALPDELDEAQQIALAARIVEDYRADGMAVDCCIHQNVDGTNTHAHMLMPLRPITEDGLGAKSKNFYLARDMDDLDRELWLTAEELRARQSAGERLEKVYRYRNGGERRELTPTQAEGWEGCKRIGKSPVQEGRRVTDWDEPTKAEEWRERIAARINEGLEAARIDERVDHRSYERQGVDRIATLHEGSRVHAMERRAALEAEIGGIEYQPVTDVRQENIDRRGVNALIQRAGEVARSLVEQIRAVPDAAMGRVRDIAEGWSRGFERARRALVMDLESTEPSMGSATRDLYRRQAMTRAVAKRHIEPKRKLAREAAMQQKIAAEFARERAWEREWHRPMGMERGHGGMTR